MSRKKRQLILFFLLALPAVVGVSLRLAGIELGLVGSLLWSYSLTFFFLLLLWFLARALRVFLWRVSRRLAFSYFLIGLIPIPLALLLTAAAIYITGGFFLGHLYRDAIHSTSSDLRAAARSQLRLLAAGRVPWSPGNDLPIAFAYYKDGRKLAGAPELPATWQDWWAAETFDSAAPSTENLPLVMADGKPTLMAAVEGRTYGVLAVYAGHLENELSERSGVWVELLLPYQRRLAEEEQDDHETTITFRHLEYPLRLPRLGSDHPALRDFFHPGIENPGLLDRPLLLWVERSDPFFDLTTGDQAADHVAANLTGSLRTLTFHLFSRSAEVDIFVYVVFITLVFLLFDIYLVAALMALFMSFGLSRAVNQLTRATERMQRGEFTTRIDVRRHDQIGALQRSFNRMSSNLETLIAEAAQKETLETELAIARELQQSLLPNDLDVPDSLRFATHFEPSAAIGGDYYDILPTASGKLAVFIGDVSGHGLSAGLRMAMVKSALQLLCEEETRPERILARLHRLIRAGGPRGFVTATLALVDSERHELTVTNAGHTPTYLCRRGKVTEILLPGNPLGTLAGNFGQKTIELEPGDVVVWLSDGLIEATDADMEPVGYERIADILADGPTDVEAVRDELLAAVARHTGGTAAEDDLTVVVMAYREASSISDSTSPSSE